MTEDKKKHSPPHLAELVVSAERHQQLQDIVLYVKNLHSFIDPDMYRISMKKINQRSWNGLLRGSSLSRKDSRNALGSP